ncbi:hypothetical protein ANCCAN_17385 [Ancylostoma caninum]|uniref:Uncharacterized protein n=1 Tax=Ancylostoma caninum TaxID=29170 RepID=A0A368FZ17_ANCCA|nr:hypothetical protein ANCCAN_17385 [Ancylostoma caninum]
MVIALDTKNTGLTLELKFEKYWEEKRGETMIQTAIDLRRQLEKRIAELECQDASVRQEFVSHGMVVGNETSATILGSNTPQVNLHSWPTLERRLLGNEFKVPEFYGKASDFDSFWEMFEELVHKQPYSNIEKMSILINCCKGDTARAIKLIPRTGDSYEKAIEQLKMQYRDPRGVTTAMIKQLKAMKHCKDHPRSLPNNLNDIKPSSQLYRSKEKLLMLPICLVWC